MSCVWFDSEEDFVMAVHESIWGSQPVNASAERSVAGRLSVASTGGRAILSSTVGFRSLPEDPVLAQTVKDIATVLQNVNPTYFPQIDYTTAEVSATQTVLYFCAYGMNFRVGVVLGTNGVINAVLLVLDNGQIIGPEKLNDINRLRITLDKLGEFIGGNNV